MLSSPASRAAGRASVRRVAPRVAFAVLAARCVAAFLFPEARGAGALDLVVAVVGLAAVLAVVAGGSVSHTRVAAAGAAAAFWLAPCVAALLQGQEVPITSAAMALVAVAIIVGPYDDRAMMWGAIAVGAVVVILSLVYGGLTAAGLAEGAFHTVGDYERITLGVPALAGVATHPNLLGPIAGFTALAAGGVALANRHRPGTWVLPVVALVCLLWTQSRTSIIIVVLAAAAGLFVARFPRAAGPTAVGAMVVSLLPPLATLQWGEQLPLGRAFNGRDLAWGPALQAFRDSPGAGYGPDAFTRSFWRSLPEQSWEPLHAHNQVLETAASAGLLGLAGLVAVATAALLLVVARTARPVRLARTGRRRSRGLVANGRLVTVLVVFVGLLAGLEVPLGLTYFPASYLLPALVLATVCFAESLTWHRRRGSA